MLKVPVVIVGVLLSVGLFVGGCTGNDSASEPVEKDDAPPVIPDMPGESGESAEKPAGSGEAGTTELPVTEKSQPNVEAAARKAGSGTVNSGALNVRSGPGMKHAVVKVLQKGETVTTQECGPIWCQIGDGQYVAKKFLTE